MGTLFYGSYPRSLDAKGRLLLPSSLFEEGTPEALYILRGFDGCLALYLPEDFEALVANLKRLDQHDPGQRAYLRIAAASMKKLKLDAHGRVLLGVDTLAEYGLGQEVTVNGAIDHLEVWDRKAYASYTLHNGSIYDAPLGRS